MLAIVPHLEICLSLVSRYDSLCLLQSNSLAITPNVGEDTRQEKSTGLPFLYNTHITSDVFSKVGLHTNALVASWTALSAYGKLQLPFR
jgi:hypothetical protein